MMQKSGYMQVSNSPAYDPSGRKCRIIEIAIDGMKYAIETPELSKLLLYGRRCPIREISHYYGKRLGDTAGAATLSYSKKGIILEIFPGRRYMASRSSAESLLRRYMSYTKISEIPGTESGIHSCNNPTVQSTITPWVAV